MTHPTDDELEAMAARLEASAYVRSPAHEIEAAAMLRACKGLSAALEARAEEAEAEARDAYTQGLEDAAKVVGEKSGAAREKLARCGSEGHPGDEHVWSAIISHLDLAQSSIRARAALSRGSAA